MASKVLFLAVAVARYAASQETTTSTLPQTTVVEESSEGQTTAAPSTDEAGKSKRTIDHQLGYGRNDVQPRYQRLRPDHQQRRILQQQHRNNFYSTAKYSQQPQEYAFLRAQPQDEPQNPDQHPYAKPQQPSQAPFIPSPSLGPFYADGEAPAPQAYPEVVQQGFRPHPALRSPLFGAPQLFGAPPPSLLSLLLQNQGLAGPQFVPVLILRVHDTAAGPQVAQAFPALLHSPAPPPPQPTAQPAFHPALSLQALLPLLQQQQYQQPSAEAYQQPDKVVYIAPPDHKVAFGSKKSPVVASPPPGKLRKTAVLPEHQEADQHGYKFGQYKDKPQ